MNPWPDEREDGGRQDLPDPCQLLAGGMRNEWAIPMQQLLIDQNVDHFLEETDRIVKQYYKES